MASERVERHITRAFAMGALEFAIATSTTEDRDIVESLFRDVPTARPFDGPGATFSLLRSDADGTSWTVGGPGASDRSVPTLGLALSLLTADINLGALGAEPEHLHLHAAAATHGGRAVVIAAERDTGKTTTVAHLVARGWGFVTDETVRLSMGTSEITGFPKPLSIKPGGRELVEHLGPWMIPPLGDGVDDFQFVPISASGAAVAAGGTPHLVVLLRRNRFGPPEAGPTARRLHPADAVVALMQETLDAERFGSAALRLAELAAGSLCFELVMGTPAETVDAIEAMFRFDLDEPLGVSVLPRSDAFSPGVGTVTVGDRAVVHDDLSGRIFALDAGGAQVWKQLGGLSTDDDLDVDGPVIGPFVAQLRALGVLAGAA